MHGIIMSKSESQFFFNFICYLFLQVAVMILNVTPEIPMIVPNTARAAPMARYIIDSW